ncbi:hypothetical protein A9Q99_09960 [Gammaproteobacteria bacterium 45_16_T64]|nr:hypothetical protein A9Q99_09960 [Gammaproteobacteria bacterium 45_16_T64]
MESGQGRIKLLILFIFISLMNMNVVLANNPITTTPYTNSFANIPAYPITRDGIPIASYQLSSVDSPISLGEHIELLEDKNHTLSIDDFLNPESTHTFTQSTSEIPSFGYTNSAYWGRIKLHAPARSPPWLLEFAYAPLDKIELFIVDSESATYTTRSAGDSVNYAGRDFNYHKVVFKLPLSNNDPLIYFRIQSLSSMQIPIIAWTEESFVPNLINETLFWGLYFGCLSVMMLYNFFLGFTIREKVYGYYSLYVAGIIFFQLTVNGFSSKYLWPNHTEINNAALVISLNLLATFSAFFSMEFLRLKHFSINSYRLLLGLILCFVACILATPFIPYLTLIKTTITVFTIGIFVVIWSGLICWIRGYQPARIYLAAWTIMLVGAMFYALKTLSFLPSTLLTNYAVTIGSAAEMILLSIALGDRINGEIRSRNMAQRSSTRNLKKYERLYEDALEGLFQYSFETDRIKCNLALARLCGYEDVDSFVRSSDANYLSRKAKYNDLSDDLHSSDSIIDHEFQLETSRIEKPTWCSITMKLIKNEYDEPERIDGFMVDITERKLKEQVQEQVFSAQKQLLTAREEALKNLNLADELKNDFLATLSHELRTPMHGILGCIQLLESSPQSGDTTQAYGGLVKSSDDMIEIVNRLLNFTEIQGGKCELQNRHFSLDKIIQPLFDASRHRCEDKKIVFSPNLINEMPPFFYGDSDKILIILDNLVDNAIKFTNRGSIIITIKCEELLSKDQNHGEALHRLFISIMDTGIGISDEAKSSIFSMFTQEQGGFNRLHGGLGLGLALCKKYVDLMDGDLSFTTELDKGSEFFCTLPLYQSEAASISTEKTTSHIPKLENSKQASILIVEDNITNQLVISALLKKAGHSTQVANNGVEALTLLDSNFFDIILMDCQMPLMDGLEATRNIRKHNARHKYTPIVAITANAMSSDRRNCLDSGMNDYIKKPFKKDLLLDKVNYWLQLATTQPQAKSSE